MNHNIIPPGVLPAPKMSTALFAQVLCCSSQTIRGGFCRDGHFLGVVPTKLANGRLLWDVAAVARAMLGKGITANDIQASVDKVKADAVAVLADANQHSAKINGLIDRMVETGATTAGEVLTFAGEAS